MSNFKEQTDHQLITLYEQGIDEAFDVLLERNQQVLFGYILRLTNGNQDMANDVFQETFTKAIICIRNHQYQQTGKFSAWLMRVAHNIVVDGVRRDHGFTPVNDDKADFLFNNISLSENVVEEAFYRGAVSSTLQRLVALLPENQQEIVRLRFIEELSFKEIAERLDISINTALGRIRYALINLRKLVAEHELQLVG
ncbi:MAG: sigma-70 family RNA polymerase sigma factor [Bacteroidaceae bacterium]|nr:sigma-70 family RNA polymerase sigma factor [Bacteroidaceae bacterium]